MIFMLFVGFCELFISFLWCILVRILIIGFLREFSEYWLFMVKVLSVGYIDLEI